jgi:diguanylate cyclase (GGDEF)-like protein/PAS domain S-box-containing protein
VVYQFRVNADGSWLFCYLSEGIRQLYELSPEAVYADHHVLSQCILEEDRILVRASVVLANQHLLPWVHEHRIYTPSGQFKWVRGQALPKRQQDGGVLWSGILIDITESKKTEASLRRLQKIYTAIIEADKLISKTQYLSELFQGICKIAVELGGMKMAWIGTPDSASERLVSIACYGESTDYLDNIFISIRSDVPEGHGPAGTAFRENKTVLNQDFQTDATIKPWLERIKAYGWEACATFPVQRGGKPYVVLTVYSTEKNAFDSEVVSLLEGLAADISHAVDVLDLKHEQQEIARQFKQSEEIFQTLFQTIHQGVVYQNASGQIVAANPAAERILDLSLETMLGVTSIDPHWQAIHPDGTPFLGKTHPAMLAIKTGKPVYGVVMGINSSNIDHTVWINIDANPIFKKDTTEIDYVYSIFDDITQQLQWEAILKESEARFRNLANAAPTLIWVADVSKNCTWFNETWLQYTGKTLEQECGNGWIEGIYANDLPRCLEIYISHFEARQAFNMEYRLRGRDGEFRWFIDVGKPRFDEQGEFCGYIGMLTDINERKKLEETMRFQQFSLNHASEEIFWIGKEGKILNANQATCLKLGYSETEIKQLTIADFDPYFPIDKWSEQWQKLKQKKNLRFESIHKTRAGKTFPIEVVANYFEYGGEEYICAFVRDMTEHISLLQELENQARKDFLTSLPNRRYFFALAEQALSFARRYNNSLSLLMMDVDFFKAINDRYGHKSGDLVLQKLATVCSATLREIDVVGRMGGEEFAILLPDTRGSYALEVAERVRLALENAAVILEEYPEPLKFTVSIGLTTLDNGTATVDKLLQEADAALYQAKNSGRNTVVVF